MRTFAKNIFKIFLIFCLVLVLGLNNISAVTYQELQKQIDAKKAEINQLIQQAEIYNAELEKTQATSKTLSNELKRIQNNLNNINYKIKINEVQIEKLTLELEQLEMDIGNTSEEINIKKVILAKTLQNLYEKNKELDPLIIVLKNMKISDALSEINNIQNISINLQITLDELEGLKENLTNKQTDTARKKQELEQTRINLNNQKRIVLALQDEKTTLLNKTKNQEKNYQTLLENIEKQRSEIELEISRLEEALKAQIDPSLLPSARAGLLLWPVSNPVITQGFGVTSASKYFYNIGRYKTPTHNGIDLKASLGTPIYAAEDGEVIAVGNQDLYCYKGAYGKYVVIRHYNNLTTLYAHLSLQTVKKGDIVKRGDIIGYSGSSGFATGPHLHFTVYFSPTFQMTGSASCGPMPIGAPVNPLPYLQ
ncbi:MAG: peptidoglycan DD-metalloendopeptidase family protein [Patescibacteria group bacterium]|jgi:murein DD-endopeptidase MepM/ murein hydrolase activator NlpD|nr:peptidoglycan DD-metalloendopeptidase family protein [Patescibacteria group bacterium]